MRSDLSRLETNPFTLRVDELILLVVLAAILIALAAPLIQENKRPRTETAWARSPGGRYTTAVPGDSVNAVPWAILPAFGGWLLVWVVLNLTRLLKARAAGERLDLGPWVLALLAVVFVANCANWISLFTAFGSIDRQRTVGLGLILVALAGSLLAARVTLAGRVGRFTRRLVFAVVSLVLAAAVVVPNLMLLHPHVG